MPDLEKKAHRLADKLADINKEIEKTQGKLSETVKDKQSRLLKAATSSQSRTTESITRLNEAIRFLEQEIEDREFVRKKLHEELIKTGIDIKNQRISEREEMIALHKDKVGKIDNKIRKLNAQTQKLTAKISLGGALLDGVTINVSPDQNHTYQISELEAEIGAIKPLSEVDILRDLGIGFNSEVKQEIQVKK